MVWFVFAEEAEDDDDPEYNFLDDLDEPDLEDYRTDRAVQITSRCRGPGAGLVNVDSGPLSADFSFCFSEKEVNELLDELFDTVSRLCVSLLRPLLTRWEMNKQQKIILIKSDFVTVAGT